MFENGSFLCCRKCFKFERERISKFVKLIIDEIKELYNGRVFMMSDNFVCCILLVDVI